MVPAAPPTRARVRKRVHPCVDQDGKSEEDGSSDIEYA